MFCAYEKMLCMDYKNNLFVKNCHIDLILHSGALNYEILSFFAIGTFNVQ